MLEIFGGPDRDRTDDLFHAMEARSQTAPQAHLLRGCNFSILSVAAGFVNARKGGAPAPRSIPSRSIRGLLRIALRTA